MDHAMKDLSSSMRSMDLACISGEEASATKETG